MATWHFIYQRNGLPTSVVRADGVREDPPDGLIRYLELEEGRGGPWTTEAATDPLAIESVEWPHPCVWADLTHCQGPMIFVEHVRMTVTQGGVPTHPAGWQCQACGNESVGGMAVLTQDAVIEDEPDSH
jgi:hypothetical protein